MVAGAFGGWRGRGPEGSGRGGDARSRDRLRRPDRVPGGGGRGRPPCRGAGARRRRRRRRAPLRAGLLGPATPPKGGRDRPGTQPRPGDPERSCGRRGRSSPAPSATCNAGTVEFLVAADGALRVHRDEPAHPGRAHGHRGGHRRSTSSRPSSRSRPAQHWPTSASPRTASR